MQDTTRHIREPFLMLGGVICGFYGLHGTVSVSSSSMKVFAYFLLGIFLIYTSILFFDLLFMEFCGLYPSNVIYQTLLWKPEDIPIQEDKKATLKAMEAYPVRQVNWMVEHNVWRWSCLISLFYAGLSFYSYQIVVRMTRAFADGPVGLGTNYKLGAWRAELLIKHWIEQEESQLFWDGMLRDQDNKVSHPDRPLSKRVQHLSQEGGGHQYGAV